MATLESKPGYTCRCCNNCGKPYNADNRNLKRGWGLACSKKCAASLREKAKPAYNPITVAENNLRRANWNSNYRDDYNFDEMDGAFSNEDYLDRHPSYGD